MDTHSLKQKLATIKKNIGTKHHKVTSDALCSLIFDILDLIDNDNLTRPVKIHKLPQTITEDTSPITEIEIDELKRDIW